MIFFTSLSSSSKEYLSIKQRTELKKQSSRRSVIPYFRFAISWHKWLVSILVADPGWHYLLSLCASSRRGTPAVNCVLVLRVDGIVERADCQWILIWTHYSPLVQSHMEMSYVLPFSWRHYIMETPFPWLDLCEGNPPVRDGFRSQRLVIGTFMFSLLLAWTSC